jgi:predicted DNA-binding protein
MQGEYWMKRNRPLSVYFTLEEREKLGRLAEHCKRAESDQVRWLVEEYYNEIFGRKHASKKKPA